MKLDRGIDARHHLNLLEASLRKTEANGGFLTADRPLAIGNRHH